MTSQRLEIRRSVFGAPDASTNAATNSNAKDRDEWARVELDEALRAAALLFGRRSYEFFAARWPSRSGEWADRLKGLPKYVVSSTLVDPAWNNSTVLDGEVVNEVSKLKQELDGEIVVYASAQLVNTLMEVTASPT
jgi:dihydrofolate reductase